MYVDYNTLDGIEVIQDNNKRAEAKLDDVAANVKEIADLQKVSNQPSGCSVTSPHEVR